MLLAIDIGNTNITLGVFEGDDLLEVKRILSNINYSVNEYSNLLMNTLENRNITGCIIASVVNGLDTTLFEVVKSVFSVESLILNNNLDYGITLKIDYPNELGADRIANSVAAYKLYKLPVIVIDFGTANTFDVINSDGEYIGGLIAPGINMQLKALGNCTSKLPSLEAQNSEKIIGTNTIDSIMSGVIRGTACMIDGMLYEYEKRLNCSVTTVITGGLGNLISKYMKHKIDDINPNLTLFGLKEIFVLNENS